MFMIIFLPVRLAFLVTSTDLWHRLTNNPHLDSTRLECAMANSKTGFIFNVQTWPVLVSDGASLTQKTHLDTRTKVVRVAGIQLGVHLPISLTLRRRGTMGDSVPNLLQSTSHHHLHLLYRLVHFQNFLDHRRSITFNRCMINMVKVTIFSLGTIPFYSTISNVLTLRLLWLIIPLSRWGGWAVSRCFHYTINRCCWHLLKCTCGS